MAMLKSFETERLVIRPLQMGDLDDLYRLIYAEAEVRQYFTRTDSYEGAKQLLIDKARLNENLNNPGFGYWGVVRKEDHHFIGQILLGPPEPTPWIVLDPTSLAYPLGEEVEIGYAFGKMYWGYGYASEACQPVIDYAFSELKLKRLVNSVLRKNTNSVNLMKRLGFRIEKNLHPLDDAHPLDEGVVGILEAQIVPLG
jgi:ribosomal-protein-alanine N-acetyltransferase